MRISIGLLYMAGYRGAAFHFPLTHLSASAIGLSPVSKPTSFTRPVQAATSGDGTATDDDRHSRAFNVLESPVVDIVGVRLDAPAEVSAALWQLLSRDEQERARKFRYAEHRQHYIVARASLRRLLAERLRIAPRAVEFVETKYGKPRLAPVHGSAGVEFNLSHSGILALYAFTRGSRCRRRRRADPRGA